MRNVRRLGLDTPNRYDVAQDRPRWFELLNPGKVPRGPSAVTGSFVCKDL